MVTRALTVYVWLLAGVSAAALSGCSTHQGASPVATSGSAEITLDPASVFGQIAALPTASQQAIFSEIDQLTLPQYYQILLRSADGKSVAIGGAKLANSVERITAMRDALMGLSQRFHNLGEFRASFGMTGTLRSFSEFTDSLNRAGSKPALNLVGYPCEATAADIYNTFGINQFAMAKALATWRQKNQAQDGDVDFTRSFGTWGVVISGNGNDPRPASVTIENRDNTSTAGTASVDYTRYARECLDQTSGRSNYVTPGKPQTIWDTL